MAMAERNHQGEGNVVAGLFGRLRSGFAGGGSRTGAGQSVVATPAPRRPGGIEGGPLAWAVPAAGVVAVVLILALSLA